MKILYRLDSCASWVNRHNRPAMAAVCKNYSSIGVVHPLIDKAHKLVTADAISIILYD
jgi:hypothetical protein